MVWIPYERQQVFSSLEHTAHIGVRAFGATLQELFANVAGASRMSPWTLTQVQPSKGFELQAVGEELEALLVNWINELIYWIDARRVGFARFEVQFLDDGMLTASAWGEALDAKRHPARLVVKAATYP